MSHALRPAMLYRAPLKHEHRSTRICLFTPLSLDGGGDAGLRGFEHVDADRVSGGDEEGDR